MQGPTTLMGFLESAGFKVRVYDLGRRIEKISRRNFEQFEQQEIVYPFPLQQQAWLALSLHQSLHQNHSQAQKQNNNIEPVIWFLRFPLDETGKLVLASRDYFLHRLLEASVTKGNGENGGNDQTVSEAALKDNPHVFKPREDKMAIFHAILTHSLKAPASRFYPHAIEYFSGSQGWDQWNFVGFQGIADLSVRCREDHNEQLIGNAIAHIPAQPLEALCQCLENVEIPLIITTALDQRLQQELATANPNTSLISFICRAVSLSESKTVVNNLLQRVLTSAVASQPDILSAVAARNWQRLSEQPHAQLYLDALASADQETFNTCLADLLYLPGIRNNLLAVIRDPQRPNRLREKFGHFMQGFTRRD
mgnify:FL=1